MKKRLLSVLLALVMLAGLLPTLAPTAKAVNDVQLGDYVQLGSYLGEPILWRCVDIDENGPLMLSDKVLCLKSFDAAGANVENGSSHGRGYYKDGVQGYYRRGVNFPTEPWSGSNYWGDSNIRDWLNSDELTVTWSCGNPPAAEAVNNHRYPYDSESGFLRNFTKTERKAMLTVTQKSILDAREYTDETNALAPKYYTKSSEISTILGTYDAALSEQVTDTVFLLDVKQLYNVWENDTFLGGGYYYGYPSAAAAETFDSLTVGQKCDYILRTPDYGWGISVCNMMASGDVGNKIASNDTSGIRPAFYFNPSASALFTSGDGSAVNPYAIAASGTVYSVNVDFEDAEPKGTAYVKAGGTTTGFTKNGTKFAPESTSVQLSVEPNSGSSFQHWKIVSDSGTQYVSKTSYSFTATEDVTVTPVFKKVNLLWEIEVDYGNEPNGLLYLRTVGSSSTSNGYLASKQKRPSLEGKAVEIRALPNEGYEFWRWEIVTPSGTEIVYNPVHTFIVTNQTTAKAYFHTVSNPSQLPSVRIGDYVKMGTYLNERILWRCVDIDENGALMLADRIISFKPYDAKGDNLSGSHGGGLYQSYDGFTGYKRQDTGSDNWADSNIRQWLNSDNTTVSWICGNPPDREHVYKAYEIDLFQWRYYNPYDTEEGFLTHFSPLERAAMRTVSQKSILNGYEYNADRSNNQNPDHYNVGQTQINTGIYNYDAAFCDTVADTVFLLDVRQLYNVYLNDAMLGGENYYLGTPTEAARAASDKTIENTVQQYWLRTPHAEHAGTDVLTVKSANNLYYQSAYNGTIGVRPAFYLKDGQSFQSGEGSKTSPYVVDEVRDTITVTADGGSAYVETDAGTDGYVAGSQTVTAADDTTVRLKADAKPRYTFAKWEITNTAGTQVITDAEASFVITEDTAVNAVFTPVEKRSTASSAIKIGDYVQLGEYNGLTILWRCVDIDENGPLMLSDKVLCLKAFDVAGTNTANGSSHGRGNPELEAKYGRPGNGSNYWGDSNLRDWLNSDKQTVTWSCGNPPDREHVQNGNAYADEAGFLSHFTADEKGVIKTVTQKQLLDEYEYTAAPTGTAHAFTGNIADILQNYDTADSELCTDKMFLLDVKQLHTVWENDSLLGGTELKYYLAKTTEEALRKADYTGIIYTGAGWPYWLRTPTCTNTAVEVNPHPAVTVRAMQRYEDSQVMDYYVSTDNVGVRPAFYLNTDECRFDTGDGSREAPYTTAYTAPKATITDVSVDGSSVTATFKKEMGIYAWQVCAFYDANGRFIEAQFNHLWFLQSSWTPTFTCEKAWKTAKLFCVEQDTNAPLAVSKTVIK